MEKLGGVTYVKCIGLLGEEPRAVGKFKFWNGECAIKALNAQIQWELVGRVLHLKESL